jgi:hypothetical protein
MDQIKRTFYNPPQGGNGRGVPTMNPMASFTGGPTVQAEPTGPSPGRAAYVGSTRAPQMSPMPGPGATNPTLRGDLEVGIASARLGIVEARHAGARDMRNFDPGAKPAQTTRDPSPTSAYDYESRQVSSTDRQGGTKQRVTPVSEPDTRMSYQTNGKPYLPMPR